MSQKLKKASQRLIGSIAFLGASVLAHGQAASPPEPAAQQESAEDTLQEVTVTGIRASVEAAQEVKRMAPSNVEAITAEDLGKFTDTSISGALQRVPGVAVQRNVRGYIDGDGVTIRGLGPAFVTSTINGRELLGNPSFWGTGSGRNLDYGAIPPEILAGVTVYKSPVSSIVESGLGGEVDMKTLRPLDYRPRYNDNYFGSVSLGLETSTEVRNAPSEVKDNGNFDKDSPRIGALVGGKFFDNTLGVYVSGLYSAEHTFQRIMSGYPGRHNIKIADEQGNITTYNDISTLDGYASNNSVRQYTKKSYAAGLQWKPNDSWEVNVDHVDNSFETDLFNYGYDYFGGFQVFTGDPVFQPGGAVIRNNQLVYFDTSKVTGALAAPYNNIGLTHVVNTNDFENSGFNVAWKGEGRTLSFDASHGKALYLQDWLSPDADNSGAGVTHSTLDASGKTPIITFDRSDLDDPSQYGNFLYFYFQALTRSKRDAFRLDFEQKLTAHATLKIGSRWADTKTNFVLMYGPDLGPVDPSGYFSGKSDRLPFYPVPTPQVSEAGFCASNPQYCGASNVGKGSLVGGFPTVQEGKPGDVMNFDPSQSYFIHERNLAFYTQLDFDGAIFGREFDANAGVRAVQIDEAAKAFQGTSYLVSFIAIPDPTRENQTVIAEDTNEYWEYLPTANINWHLNDDTNLRFGVAKTMSLPNYQNLAPLASIVIYTEYNGGVSTPTYNGGNTRLKPLTAWNFDVTAEHYTSYGGAYIASAFYKDVKNLTASITALGVQVPGQGDTLFNVTTVANENDGHTYGLELGTNQPFTFLPAPWNGFGVQANYTYVDGKLNLFGESKASKFPGTSKHNVNVSGYYERGGWAARVAYAYRTSYLNAFGSADSSVYTRGSAAIDASLTRDIGSRFQIVLTGTNLTGKDQYDFIGSGKMFQSYFERPRTYSLALRGSF